MEQVRLRSAVLVESGRVPRSCVRHGQPVADGADVALQSRPPFDKRMSFGGVFTIAVRTADHLQQIKRVPVQGWPFCPRCLRRRGSLRRAAQALFFGGIVLAIVAVVLGLLGEGPQPLLMIPILAAVAAAIAAGFVLGQSSWSHIAGAVVSDDSEWVIFRNAHPTFAAEARGLTMP